MTNAPETQAEATPETDASPLVDLLGVGKRYGNIIAPSFVLPVEDDRVVVTVDGRERTERLGTSSTYTHQLQVVGQALREGERSLVELERSRTNARLIDEVYRAAGMPLRQSVTGTHM
jgi:hypothetical protein